MTLTDSLIQTKTASVCNISEIDEWKDRIDVMILCGGSATDLNNTPAFTVSGTYDKIGIIILINFRRCLSIELSFLHFLETIRTAAGITFFSFITLFGEELVMIAVLCLLYWCVDKRLGYRIGFSYFLSGLCVQTLKITFKHYPKNPCLCFFFILLLFSYSKNISCYYH